MQRFSPLLFVIALSTPLLAQIKIDPTTKFDRKASMDLIAVTKYCTNVNADSDSQVQRIFARTSSAYGQSAEWLEFGSRAAWSRAGSPKPLALVWYRDANIVRVAISASEDEDLQVYADYCYRQDGTLARLRSVPSMRRKCEPNRDQCRVVLREVRFYPPEGPILKTYGLDGLLNVVSGSTGIFFDATPAERTVETFVPMKWPEYRHVSDLPFSDLLYATLR